MILKTIPQIVSSIGLCLFPIFLGLLPKYIYYRNNGIIPEWAGRKYYNLILTILSCFGGGIVMSSALLHMLPDVRSSVKNLEEINKGFHFLNMTFLPEFLVLLGLTMIYIVEEIAHLIMADDGRKIIRVQDPAEEDEGSNDISTNLEDIARNASIAHGIPVREIVSQNYGTSSRAASISIVENNSPHFLYVRSIENLHRAGMIKSGDQSSVSEASTPSRSRANSIPINLNNNRLRRSLLFNIAENDLRRKVEEALAKVPPNNQAIIVNTNNTQLNHFPNAHGGISSINGTNFMNNNNNNNNNSSCNKSQNPLAVTVSNQCSTSELIHDQPVKKERNHEAILTSLLALVALSVQSLMEGIAIGVQYSGETVYMLFGTVAAHKFVVSFMLGMEMCEARIRLRTFVLSMLFFSFVSPIGVFIGIILTPGQDEETSTIVVVLEGLACGTLLFVVFFEILQRERMRKALSFRESKFIGFIQIISIIAGFAVMVWLINLYGGEH